MNVPLAGVVARPFFSFSSSPGFHKSRPTLLFSYSSGTLIVVVCLSLPPLSFSLSVLFPSMRNRWPHLGAALLNLTSLLTSLGYLTYPARYIYLPPLAAARPGTWL